MSVTISGLPPATSLTGAEFVPVVQDSYTKRTTAGDIAGLATSVPTPVGHDGEYLTNDGTNVEWGPLQIDGLDVGYLDLPQNLVNDDYTFALSDRGKHLYTNAEVGTPLTWTVPLDENVPFPIGTVITAVNKSDSELTIDSPDAELFLAASGAVASVTVTLFGMATLLKIEEDIWMINGVGVS